MQTSDPPRLRTLLRPFDSQSHAAHVLTVGTGVTVGVLAYVGCIVLLGGVEHLAGSDPSAVRARRIAIGVAGVIAAAFFAGAWLRGFGGPLLNLLYLVATVVGGPILVDHLYGATTPVAALFGTGTGLDHWVGLVIAGTPGAVVFFAILFAWDSTRSEQRRREWARTHMPPPLKPGHSAGGKSAAGRTGTTDDGRPLAQVVLIIAGLYVVSLLALYLLSFALALAGLPDVLAGLGQPLRWFVGLVVALVVYWFLVADRR